jgi:pyruvate/2-oxoacid:ferredoxin oxidoreductase beta subunit
MADEEEYFEIEKEEEKIVIAEEIRKIAEKGRVIESFPFCIGCGSLLGLKIALQEINPSIVIASGHIALIGKYPKLSLKMPLINASNPAAVAKVLSKNYNVLVFADDETTARNFDTLSVFAKKNENIFYICNNNQRCQHEFIEKIEAAYFAAASVGYLDDYIKKLKKAKSMQGFRFIDLLCPCPALWGFDPSLTIDVAKMAVNTDFWPLFEMLNNKKQDTFRPSLLEPLGRYIEMQERYKNLSENEIEKIKGKIEKRSVS